MVKLESLKKSNQFRKALKEKRFHTEYYSIFEDLVKSFELSFLNKSDETERPIISEYFQRCFGAETNSSISSESN